MVFGSPAVPVPLEPGPLHSVISLLHSGRILVEAARSRRKLFASGNLHWIGPSANRLDDDP